MSVLKNIVSMGVGAAIGVGIGYSIFKADATDCKAVYQKDLAAFEETYKGIEIPQGVASAKDLSLEYVVAKDAGFRGLTVKDNNTGKYGIVTKQTMFSSNVYGIAFPEGLEAALKTTTAKLEVPAPTKVYAGK